MQKLFFLPLNIFGVQTKNETVIKNFGCLTIFVEVSSLSL
jgi:hypothetical protein